MVIHIIFPPLKTHSVNEGDFDSKDFKSSELLCCVYAVVAAGS